MREHARTSRRSSDLEIGTELRIYSQYVALAVRLRILHVSIRLVGPVRLGIYRMRVYGCRSALAKLIRPCRRRSDQRNCRHLGLLEYAQFSRDQAGMKCRLTIVPVQEAYDDLLQPHSGESSLRLGRLIYLASMRDYNTGNYHHDGLAASFSPPVTAREALEMAHSRYLL